MSYKEQKELEELPKLIERLEKEQIELQAAINEADFYKQAPMLVADKLSQLKQIELKQEQAFKRWDELENLLATFKKFSE